MNVSRWATPRTGTPLCRRFLRLIGRAAAAAAVLCCFCLGARASDSRDWYFSDGALFVGAQSAAADYASPSDAPWSELRDETYRIVIGPGAKRVGRCAFVGFSVREAVLPDGLESIGNYAFLRCRCLDSLELPDTLIELGRSAFCGTGIRELALGENVERVGENCFYCLGSLERVGIRSLKPFINESSIDGCPDLAEVVYSGSESLWETNKLGTENIDLFNAPSIVFLNADLPVVNLLPGALKGLHVMTVLSVLAFFGFFCAASAAGVLVRRKRRN
ncbi:MAG: leucine-rich repeat domain-containing protein [Clostridia bacterium]|nr:leucine-rich repeat domain-containing protein [Clostridia bacterium]